MLAKEIEFPSWHIFDVGYTELIQSGSIIPIHRISCNLILLWQYDIILCIQLTFDWIYVYMNYHKDLFLIN